MLEAILSISLFHGFLFLLCFVSRQSSRTRPLAGRILEQYTNREKKIVWFEIVDWIGRRVNIRDTEQEKRVRVRVRESESD